MRHQNTNLHGYELYNTFKRNPVENDWYIVPIVVVGTVVAVIALIGVEDFFNVVAQFIQGVINN